VTSGPSVFIDSPFEVTLLARELGVVQIGKVYLPRRSDSTRQFSSTHDAKSLLSECRELLTFEKRTPQAAQN
jgi:hypothetical protein